jgi:isoleucyl-tRNA synthetase
VKLDFKKLGPKFGKNMKALAQAVAQFTQADINDFERNGSISLTLNGAPSTLLAEDVTILNEDMPGWLVANEGNLTVALEVTLTDALVKEGIARELVNRIQNLRKQSGFEITDKIRIQLSKNAKTNDAVTEYNQYICGQVLGLSLELTDEVKDGTVLNFDDFDLLIKIEKN